MTNIVRVEGAFLARTVTRVRGLRQTLTGYFMCRDYCTNSKNVFSMFIAAVVSAPGPPS